MVTMNKSFIYGIFFASFTWIISLYLYFQITNTENSSKIPLDFTVFRTQEQTSVHKASIELKTNTHGINPPELIKKLKPIQRNLERIDNGNEN